MSPIGLVLNLFLGVLLLFALMLGMRLERRLKALREGHLDFTKAVAELDQAALRTESVLADLRATTHQAQAVLGGTETMYPEYKQKLKGMPIPPKAPVAAAPAR